MYTETNTVNIHELVTIAQKYFACDAGHFMRQKDLVLFTLDGDTFLVVIERRETGSQGRIKLAGSTVYITPNQQEICFEEVCILLCKYLQCVMRSLKQYVR